LGGALANEDVLGELPSGFGHGVTPVILAPAGRGAAVGGGLVVVKVVLEPASVVELVATFFLDEPEENVPVKARKATNRMTTAPPIVRNWRRF
jgi:hypothetical protein